MKLEDCNLDITLAVSAPLQHKEPEAAWVGARDSQAIPMTVFALYERSNYASFGAAPPFLKDGDNILFSYFGMLLRSVMESLVDADQERTHFEEAQALVYDPGKKARGEPWEKDAEDRARRHFRYLVLSLQASLDGLADLSALFMTGLVPVRLGRAQFSRLESWLKNPLSLGGLIVSPQEHYSREFHEALGPLVHPSGPAQSWMGLMRLFRNKAAHLGDAVFQYVGLHDNAGRFYTFVPRQWPYIWERHLKPAGSGSGPQSIPDLFRETLVHEDIIALAAGFRSQVHRVVDVGFAVLNDAYEAVKSLPVNAAALAELNGSSEFHPFEFFPA